MDYACLEQRIAVSYLDQFPDFFPEEGAPVSGGQQREFYDIMRRLFRMLSQDPSLIMPTLHEDDAFPERYKTGYRKPALQENGLKCRRAINGLLRNLFLLGQGAAPKLSKRHRDILSALGITDFQNLPPAWIWMATRPEADPVAFAYCLFCKSHLYTAGVFARLLGEKPFRRLESWMLQRGYRAYDLYNRAYPDFRLTLSYANPAWGEGPPNPGFEYKLKHTGIAAQYDPGIQNPAVMGVCIPNGMKLFLQHFSEMDQTTKDFVAEHTKKCDGCRYCVQTDRTGKRPLARIPVQYGQGELSLCPYFPGYGFSWNRLDEELTDRIIALLAFMDGFARPKQQEGSFGK